MGADIEISNRRVIGGEERGDVTARSSELTATEIAGDEIPRMLDEVPILALAAEMKYVCNTCGRVTPYKGAVCRPKAIR